MPATRETKQDATNRSWRTIAQGAVSVVLVAAATVVVDTVTPGELVDWPAAATAIGTAVVTALAAYIQRRLEGASKDASIQ
ncbi:hypothetical protein [Streptomonospora wellingtoniae]|uniref:Holin n=1 Tax=Streptomonospora wellingtoniae TaxID=3075544 RepID=A0ABU2L0L5_9ACTN|nr:hypothetical protein [Streptomonospora sp. DSM 45055]MDT0305052.1 hypothetical protein [Streptomonospora sp. DSM 45055]